MIRREFYDSLLALNFAERLLIGSERYYLPEYGGVCVTQLVL